jgi:hypothetical protein
VCGLTKTDHVLFRGSALAAAPRKARSAGRRSGAAHLAAQHGELVAQDDDPKVLGVLAPKAQDPELEQALK